MTKNTPLSEAIIEVGRRFHECELSEIQAAFGAAVATTNEEGERAAFQTFLDWAEQAKTSSDPEALGNLAAVFGAAGHRDIAIPMLEKACKIDTNGPLFCRLQNRFNLGQLYSQAEHFPEALASYEEAIEIWNNRLNTRDPRVFLKCAMDQAANSEPYNAIIDATYAGIFYTATTIGLKLYYENRRKEARPYLEKAVKHKECRPTPTGEALGGPTPN